MEPTNDDQRHKPPVQMAIGWIFAAVVIFLAQRDLRRRPPEAVRGPVAMWRAVAAVPPGAVAYLILGRRRLASLEAPESSVDASGA